MSNHFPRPSTARERHKRRSRAAVSAVGLTLAGLVALSCVPQAAFAVDQAPSEAPAMPSTETTETPAPEVTTTAPVTALAPDAPASKPAEKKKQAAPAAPATTTATAPAAAQPPSAVDELAKWGAIPGEVQSTEEAALLAGRAADEAEAADGFGPASYTPGKLDGSMLPGFAFNGLTQRKMDATWYAYVKKGETLKVRYWAVTSPGSVDVRPKVQLIRPNGVSVGTKNIARAQTTDQFSETAAQDGVYKVVLTDVIAPTGKLRDVTPGEITVAAGSSAKKGRVWSERPSVDQAAIQTASLYALSPRGVTYKISMAGYDGVSSAWTMNNIGIHKGAKGAVCVPANQSIPEPLGTTGAAVGADKNLNPKGWFAPSTQADCKGLTGYRIFLDTPSPDLPASIANWADGAKRPAADKWGKVKYVAPKITDVQATRLQPKASAARVTGKLTGQPGTLNAWIDTNNDGTFDAAVDVKQTITMLAPGDWSFNWDGKDATGADVSVKQEVGFHVSMSEVSPIHFVREDVERAGGGIRIDAVEGGKVGPLKLNWDDSLFASTSGGRTSKTPALKSPAGGQLSTAGVHGWKHNDAAGADKITGNGTTASYPNRNNGSNGSWGDQRMIDDWAFLDESSAGSDILVSMPPEPELKIEKHQVGDPVYAVDRKTATITWSITVKNFGDGLAENVVVTDRYPDGVDPKSVKLVSEPTLGKFDTLTGKWNGFDLAYEGFPAPNEATVELSAVVPTAKANETVNRINRAVVNADEVPERPIDGDCQVNETVADDTDRCDEVTTPLEGPKPAWTMSKTSDPASGVVQPGTDVTYTLTVQNTGNVPMENITVTDDLSKVLSNAKFKGEAPKGSTLNGSTLTWKVPTVPVGGEATLSYTVTVNANAWLKTIENRAYGEQPEVPPTECTKAEPCVVDHETPGKTAWTMSKTSDPASGTVKPGQDVTYTLTAKNTGDLPVKDITITDDLSKVLANAKFQGDTPAGTVRNGNTLTWKIPALAKGETRKISYTVTVNENAWLKTIENAAYGESTTVPPEQCVKSEPCVTEHETPGNPVKPKTPGLAVTGGASPLLAVGLAASLLAAAGVVLALRRRNQRKEEVTEV